MIPRTIFFLLAVTAAAVPCLALPISPRAAFLPRGGIMNIPRRKAARKASATATAATSAAAAASSPSPPPPSSASSSNVPETKATVRPKKTRFQKIAARLFDESDENHDGQVNFSEAYTLVLKLYVQLNRQAPIKPPTKKRVLQLFLDADVSNNKTLDRQEFTHLAAVVVKRGLWRVTAHKLCKMVGAPLLTEFLIRKLKGKAWLHEVAQSVVPLRFQEKVLPILLSSSFWRPVLLIAFVISLGNAVLSIINWAIDRSHPSENEDPRVLAFKE